MKSSKTRAFTLIELLVVIAIIAILAAILFPVFAQAKAAAKRTADLSNVKQITLGLYMYTPDSDDAIPPMWQVQDWGLPRYKQRIWKDSVLPYIKSGGRYPQVGELPYTTKGDGGIFAGPLNDAQWSSTDIAPYFGDATTRFPRSYAINNDAGKNERMGSTEGDGSIHWYTEQATIWPKVEPQGGAIVNQGGGGQITGLERVAETIAISSTIQPWPNTKATVLAFECTAQGAGNGGTGISCEHSVGNGGINFGFFDGHAKFVKAKQAIAKDYFDLYGPNGIADTGTSFGSQQWTLNALNGIKEWN